MVSFVNKNGDKAANINVKNFHRSLTTAVRAQNDIKQQIRLIPFSIDKADNT